jgi:DNA-binding CsgD family transcriptional regulator
MTVLATLDSIDGSTPPRTLPTASTQSAHDAEPPPLRIDESSLLSLLTATVDEIDYGLLLIARSQHVAHANHAARVELDADHPLLLEGSKLLAKAPADALTLRDALADVFQRGLRRMVTLGPAARRISISLVPLPRSGTGPVAWALALIGKPQVCQDLSVEAFARAHRLTHAETTVLKELCRGDRPVDIARSHNVALSTVRTHVGSIRAKTSVPSISALVRTVSMLPPIVGVLRSVTARPAGPYALP